MSNVVSLPVSPNTVQVTPVLRARVRYHLGYPDAESIVTLSTFPGQIQAQMVIDEGLRLLNMTSFAQLSLLLDRCDTVEQRISELADSLELKAARGATFRDDALAKLEQLHDFWAARIAGLLRCGFYKWSERRLRAPGALNGTWSK